MLLADAINEPVFVTTNGSIPGAMGQEMAQCRLIGRQGVLQSELRQHPTHRRGTVELRKRRTQCDESNSHYHCNYDFFAVACELPGVGHMDSSVTLFEAIPLPVQSA